jgi:5-methyltetrahydrofolate--homocysteine methyltransferase
MSAEAAGAAFEVIRSSVSVDKASDKCPVVIATVKGDIHDIGKNIVKLMLENYGFQITDLGKDVAPEAVVEAVLRLKAPIAVLSALMTTTVPSMARTVKLLHEKAPFCRVMVGGAVLNREYADSIGADMYAKDAMEAVRYCEKINTEVK